MAEPGSSLEARVQVGAHASGGHPARHLLLAVRALVTAVVAYAMSVVAWLATAATLLPVALERGPLGRRADEGQTAMAGDEGPRRQALRR